MKPSLPPIERLNGGEPIIAPSQNWWETGVTFNPAAVYLERSAENDLILRALLPMFNPDDPRLAEGVVAVHYRARPEVDPGSAFARSFIGLTLFTPTLQPLYRYQEPVLSPGADPDSQDALGVEDPRITRIGGLFYMVYCGVARDPLNEWSASLCMARSADLLHWEKMGRIGGLGPRNNKDGVLFPDPVNGRFYLLHRPFGGGLTQAQNVVRLAAASAVEGPYSDLGELFGAYTNPRVQYSWVGAGSVPIPMGGGRYAVIYHTGNALNDKDREYDLDAAVFDFDLLDPNRPAGAIRARLEHLMLPETPAELRSHSALQVGNVLFACGSYEYRGEIYIVYGGADTYTLAAKVSKAALFAALDRAGLENPFL